MKHLYARLFSFSSTFSFAVLFCSLLLFSGSGYAQTGGGNITFKTSGGSESLDISVVATDLFDGSANVYNLSGKTNSAIGFSSWALSSALAVGDYELVKNGYVVYNNPGASLNAVVAVKDVNNVSAKIYDMKGRLVSIPSVVPNGDGKVVLFDPLSLVSDGVYFVLVGGSGNTAFRFVKDHNGYASNKMANNTSLFKYAAAKANENYKISWSGDGIVSGEKEVQIVEGSSNDISIDVDLASTETKYWGEIYFLSQLKGNLIDQTLVTLTHKTLHDTVYSAASNGELYAHFPKVYLGENNDPQEYLINVKDERSDRVFLETNTEITIQEGLNPNATVVLEVIPNEVDITTTIFNSRSLNIVSGQTVYLVQDSDGSTVDTQVTDSNGKVFFDKVPGNISYHLVNEGENTYKKTNASFKTANVIKMSQTELKINSTAINFLYTANNDLIPANIVQKFKPHAENTETIQYMFFPHANQRQKIVDQSKEFADLLGVTIIPTTTPFPSNPTGAQIAAYHPGPYNKNKDTNIFGINIRNYSGTGTQTDGKTLPNGNGITFYGFVDLGGLEARVNHHEWGNTYNFPLINGNDTDFKTSRESSKPQIYSLQDATYDIPVMSNIKTIEMLIDYSSISIIP